MPVSVDVPKAIQKVCRCRCRVRLFCSVLKLDAALFDLVHAAIVSNTTRYHCERYSWTVSADDVGRL